MRALHVLVFLIAVPAAAFAQQKAEVPQRLRDVMVFAGTANYPQQLADKGVQGRAVFSTEVLSMGRSPPLSWSSHLAPLSWTLLPWK